MPKHQVWQYMESEGIGADELLSTVSDRNSAIEYGWSLAVRASISSVPFNQLTPAEAERLALVMEECAEVQQVIGKILRHGYESCRPKTQKTNRVLLEGELGDLRATVALMTQVGDINEKHIRVAHAHKMIRIKEFLHHQPRSEN